jgi:hypothetical protein
MGLGYSFCYIVFRCKTVLRELWFLMSLLFTDKLTISEEAIAQEIGGETVILDLSGEHYFGLDQVGTRIWQLVDEVGVIQTVFERMLEEYDVEPEPLQHDLNQLLGELVELGLMEVISP